MMSRGACYRDYLVTLLRRSWSSKGGFFSKNSIISVDYGKTAELDGVGPTFTAEKARNSIFADLLLLWHSLEASEVGFQNLIQKLKIIQKLVHMFELKAAQKALSQWRGLGYR
jgi:hypothetical protein